MTCGLLSAPVSCRIKVASISSSPSALWYQQEERPLWPGYRSSTVERYGNMGKESGIFLLNFFKEKASKVGFNPSAFF